MDIYLLREKKSRIWEWIDWLLNIEPGPDTVLIWEKGKQPPMQGQKLVAMVSFGINLPEESVLEMFAREFNGTVRLCIPQDSPQYSAVTLPYASGNMNEFITYFGKLQELSHQDSANEALTMPNS